MRIGIDARLFTGKNMTGIAVSQYEIVKQLALIDKKNEYYLFSREKIQLDFQIPKNWHEIVEPFKQGMVWYNTKLINLLKIYKIDIFWNCNHILPMRKPKGVKYVLTIHDLALCKFKGIGETSNVVKQKLFVRHSCRIADKIAVVSECTKKDLMQFMQISEDKIVVCYNGGAEAKNRVSDDTIKVTREKYNITGHYIFYLGTLEPRKNILTAVKAFDALRKYEDIQFVISGGKGWKYHPVLDQINKSNYKEDIILTGYVTPEEKSALYSDAMLFVFPSIYEGFGIPILEAFSYGTPVITANNSSLAEVGGNAAFYIQNALDVNELATAMYKVLHLDVPERERLRKSEQRQSQKFSWKESAYTMLHIFEKTMKQQNNETN